MLRITEERPDATLTRLRLDGRVVGEWIEVLVQACAAAREGGERLVLDMTGVHFLDPEAVRLVKGLMGGGSKSRVPRASCASSFRGGTMDQLGLVERYAGTMATAAVAGRDEAALIERLRQGEESAFAEIVRCHAGRMLAVARRILVSEEDARDAVQEAFLSALRSIGGFREGAAVATWLHRITVNAALMRLRCARRRPERSLEELLPTFDETGHRIGYTGPWREPSQEGEQELAELRATVRRAISELPARHRAVLVLRDIEELSTRETAHLLGLTETAVKIRLHRARQALRTLLEPSMIPSAPR